MADDDLIHEELERVYRLYGERTRQFRRSLYGLIFVSLAIFLLIVLPFLTLRDQVAEMLQREAALAVELQRARDAVADTAANLEAMREIRNAFAEFAEVHQDWQKFQSLEQQALENAPELEVLRRSFAHWNDSSMAAWLRGEARRPPDDIIQTNRRLFNLDQRACFWDSGVAHVACQVCEAFTQENGRIAWRLSKLSAIEEAARSQTQSDLAALVERACGWLTAGKAHWTAAERRSPDSANRIRGWLSFDLHAYDERLGALHSDLRDRLPERQLEVERIGRERTGITAQVAIMQEQLSRIASFDRIATPAGDLPVGLGQIVLLFPVVIAIGFLVVANGHVRIVGLQRAFVRLCRKRDSTGEVLDDRHIFVIAPLWPDPGEPIGARVVKWAIMVTPMALMVANLILIGVTEALTAQLPDDAVISPAAYLMMYAASLALQGGSLWHIWRSGQRPADDDTSARSA